MEVDKLKKFILILNLNMEVEQQHNLKSNPQTRMQNESNEENTYGQLHHKYQRR